MNRVILMGRLVRDPETRPLADSYVSNFCVAVDRKYKKDGGQAADFPNVVAFGKTAEFIDKYFHKGMKIAIEGRIQTSSYEKDGRKHYTTEVVAESVEFAESKKVEEKTQGNNEAEEWVAIPENVELPFT